MAAALTPAAIISNFPLSEFCAMARSLMLNWIAVSAALTMIAGHALAASESSERFGVAAATGTSVCAYIDDPRVSVGEPIAVITTDEPQRVVSGTITAKLDAPCETLAPSYGQEGPFYGLSIKAADGDSWLGIVIRKPASPPRLIKGIAEVKIGSEVLYFRECTSTEGIHFTAWAGRPFKGRPLWHGYYYLGYDVEASCTKRDYLWK